VRTYEVEASIKLKTHVLDDLFFAPGKIAHSGDLGAILALGNAPAADLDGLFALRRQWQLERRAIRDGVRQLDLFHIVVHQGEDQDIVGLERVHIIAEIYLVQWAGAVQYRATRYHPQSLELDHYTNVGRGTFGISSYAFNMISPGRILHVSLQ
jgi:hypothetical protein